METLTEIIIKAHELKVLENLNGCKPLQRLSLYAVDVVLFIRPYRTDIAFVKEVLMIFGKASGLHVNFAKSSAILIRGEEQDEEVVRSALPWKIDHFPCKYLGLQLGIKQLTRSEWQCMVDGALKILPGWQRGLVTRPGRLILVQQVMRARPTHHLIVAEAPKWAIEKVDQGCRAFFWAGSDAVSGGKCAVSWRRVCRPKQLVGLGILDLSKHGLALRLRWEWLRRLDDSRPWQVLNLATDKQVQHTFNSLVKWEIRDGTGILFWKDRWVQGYTIAEIAPGLVAKVKTRTVNSRLASEGLHQHAWLKDLPENLSTEELMQFIHLWDALVHVDISPGSGDKAIWAWHESGSYSAASAYRMLCFGGISFAPAAAIWKNGAPLAYKIFMWLAIQNRIWTSDRRLRHGLQDTASTRFLCDQEQDNVDHLMIQCVFARQVWYQCFAKVGIDTNLSPVHHDLLQQWWMNARKQPSNRRYTDPSRQKEKNPLVAKPQPSNRLYTDPSKQSTSLSIYLLYSNRRQEPPKTETSTLAPMDSSSPSSSSSDPDYLVATSDLDDDAATAVHQSHADAAAVALPKRPDAEGFVSFLRSPDDVDAVCKKYGVPEDHYTARLAGDLRACSPPPPGCVCVYAHALEAGMRVPLHPFFCEALAHFGVAPTQLAPNAWRIMAGFLVLCRSAGVPPSLAVFRRFFVLSVLNHRHTKRWYYFQTRFRDSSGLRFAGLPDSINGWKRGFFFLSSPTPWPCPVEWGEPSKSSFVDPVLTNEEKKSVAKLLRASGGAAVDIRTCLSDSNIAATVVTAASPAPPSARTSASSKGMDSAVYDMMKTMLAEKMARQASASAKKVKAEPGSSPLCGKKGNLDEANEEEGRPPSSDAPPAARGHSVPTSVCSPLPGVSRQPQDFADGDGTDWEVARELLQGAVAPPQQRVFAATEPSDVVASSYVAILQVCQRTTCSHYLCAGGELHVILLGLRSGAGGEAVGAGRGDCRAAEAAGGDEGRARHGEGAAEVVRRVAGERDGGHGAHRGSFPCFATL
ncbi:uncharacterized protein [Aegilops tauschii subsp. strangulata]|uniref:uncharacterized protein n=1 Tax=Aegilops tauschii subsp. strangulata TaxID=200361 RepID=UPI001ABC7BEF|nr:uncharacterized protein LOC109755716 [Aegilops tauschii subsp. strangulata]